MRGKNLTKSRGGHKNKIKVRYLVVAIGVLLSGLMLRRTVEAVGCPDVRVVFARGSGGEHWKDQNYIAFRDALEIKLSGSAIRYEYIDLDYPAIGIGDISVLAGAYFGAGEAYEFGESVKSGVKKLDELVNDASCPNTKYVLGGYSQGAMVVSKALSDLDSERIVYAATFGDPKLYLPEGAGLVPAACKGENLSDYRMYVPDCQAYMGMLGAYVPYEPLALAGKVGTWCNRRDIFCSSKHWDLTGIHDHIAYVADDLYEDASRVIYDKICKAFGISNTISSPHDTVILIDSTDSMRDMFDKYKAEALRLAEKTLATGGRVALYDYRDYREGYTPWQWCTFETCTLEAVTNGLNQITLAGGGDTPESLLASSIHVMQKLKWKLGSTKSVVVLTDAGYHEPDFDIGGTTKLDVVRMSKQIDPVNFYVVTKPEIAASYESLTAETGGRVVTTADDLTELTDYIIERYDSLPRVEEMDIEPLLELPVLDVAKVEINNRAAEGTEATVHFSTNGNRIIVVLNDAIIGATEASTGVVTVGRLDMEILNEMVLVPISDNARGKGVKLILNDIVDESDFVEDYGSESYNHYEEAATAFVSPKAPNTGKR